MNRRYRFEWVPCRVIMGRIIMKWGGGLISDKSSLCTPYIDRISALANCVSTLAELGHDIVIVHGAGSFGHIRAREFRLAEGNIPDLDQEEAISLVRSDMDALHQIVLDSLSNLHTCSHPPREFVEGTGPTFRGDLDRFLEPAIHVTFGDVVNCKPPEDFGILSGDDLMLRLSVELPDVTHVIFAMGDTPGLMTNPGPSGELIPEWSSDIGFTGQHTEEIDVTGGIFLKASRASSISEHVENVWFVDGVHPRRILEVINEGRAVGTRIRNAQ